MLLSLHNTNTESAANKKEISVGSVDCQEESAVVNRAQDDSGVALPRKNCGTVSQEVFPACDRDKGFSCISENNQQVEEYQRVSVAQKPHGCGVSRVTFTRGSNLRKYKSIHSEEKHFKCDDCDAGFTFWSHLNIHKRIHSGEKPYICGVGYITSNHLKMHKRIHTGEKPFKCDDCGARFIFPSDLKVHKRIHT